MTSASRLPDNARDVAPGDPAVTGLAIVLFLEVSDRPLSRAVCRRLVHEACDPTVSQDFQGSGISWPSGKATATGEVESAAVSVIGSTPTLMI